jgi:hypothetical protein
MWPVAVIMLAGIVYGSLYPFEFRVPANGIGPLATFVHSWNERPGSGDFIAMSCSICRSASSSC